MTWAPPQKVGDTDPLIPAAKQKLHGNSYGKPIGDDRSNVYTAELGAALRQYGANVHQLVGSGKRPGPDVNTSGIFDWAIKDQMGLLVVPPPPPRGHRKIWWWSNPGSGANEFVGPSFDVGERIAAELNINHQPVHSAIGGYLGLMGGDPTNSYVDVTYDQYLSQLWLLDNNPDVQEAYQARLKDPNAKVDVEMWFSGYSQKADGLEDALEILFGDGGFVIPKTGEVCGPGKYRILRDRINGVVQFGNPSTKGTGIARKVRPDWLYALVHNINKVNDFYAVATDPIRPAFYAIIIKAEMELPFFVHVLRIAVPVIMSYIPILGLFGPLGQVAVAGITGLNAGSQLLGSLFGQAGSDADAAVDATLEKMLTPTGLLQDVPALIQLVGALPGLQAHGMYDAADEQRAFDIVADYRR